MIKFILTLLIPAVQMTLFTSEPPFKKNQKNFARVKQAYSEKESSVKSIFLKSKVDINSFDLFIRAFKKENLLQNFGIL